MLDKKVDQVGIEEFHNYLLYLMLHVHLSKRKRKQGKYMLE